MGGLDTYIGNAGITRDKMFHKLTDEDWDAGHRGQPDRRVRRACGPPRRGCAPRARAGWC